MLKHVMQIGTTLVERVNYTLLMQSDLSVVRMFKTSCMLKYMYAQRTFHSKSA
jgi:hypothetical protein